MLERIQAAVTAAFKPFSLKITKCERASTYKGARVKRECVSLDSDSLWGSAAERRVVVLCGEPRLNRWRCRYDPTCLVTRVISLLVCDMIPGHTHSAKTGQGASAAMRDSYNLGAYPSHRATTLYSLQR